MDALAEAVKAADGPWPVFAIAIIGLYALAWKFGHELLRTVRDSNRVARAAHAEAENITASIQTNHGSKNLGDAVDRLTSEVWAIRDRLDEHIATSIKE